MWRWSDLLFSDLWLEGADAGWRADSGGGDSGGGGGRKSGMRGEEVCEGNVMRGKWFKVKNCE